MDKKIIAKTQWDEKYLRENWTMPFGSLCNLVGQACQGKKLTTKEVEALGRVIFALSMKFTEEAFNRVEKQSGNGGNDPPISFKK